jgi:hypothetical protein
MAVPEIEYDIQLSEDGQYLRVAVSGQITAANAVDMERDSAKACQAYGVTHVLLDARNAINVSSTARNATYTRDPNRVAFGFPDDCVQVFLISDTDRSHDLVVALLRAKGRPIHVFNDEYCAVEFLKRDATSKEQRFSEGISTPEE